VQDIVAVVEEGEEVLNGIVDSENESEEGGEVGVERPV